MVTIPKTCFVFSCLAQRLHQIANQLTRQNSPTSVPKKRFLTGEKNPPQNQQIHDKEDRVDPSDRGVRAIWHDVTEAVAVFTLP